MYCHDMKVMGSNPSRIELREHNLVLLNSNISIPLNHSCMGCAVGSDNEYVLGRPDCSMHAHFQPAHQNINGHRGIYGLVNS